MKIIPTVTLRYQGARIPAGEPVNFDEATALQLVKEGSAVPAGQETVKKTSVANEMGGVNSNPAGDQENAAEVEIQCVTKALDERYKRDELAEAAKVAGVEFAYDAKKAEIITALIDQGKAAALLQK